MRKIVGFTLIEILVVLFIVSIVATVSVLSISHNDNKRIETFAYELSQMLNLAEEQAILMPAVLGLSFDGRHFSFTQYQPPSEKQKKPAWVPFPDHALTLNVPNHVAVKIKIPLSPKKKEEEEEKEKKDTFRPQVVISTNGDLTPFTIYIGKPGRKASYAIIGEENGAIINQILN